MNNISIILIAHNQKELIINQIKLLKIFNNISNDDLIIVDNYSSDGLSEFLHAQNEINYIICDEHPENFSSILNICINEFTQNSNILILNPNCILLPNCIKKLTENLKPQEGIYAVSPFSIYRGYNNISTIEEAVAYSDNTSDSYGLTHIMKPFNTTVLLSHELITSTKPFDENIISDKMCFSDYFINNILEDKFLYIVNNAFEYVMKNDEHYYEKTFGIDCDTPYIKNKWNMNYLNMHYNPNLIDYINEPKTKQFNVLEIGCDCGATLLEIHNIFPNCSVYGIELNPVSANIASHIADIKIANIEDSVDLWDNIKFDYILFGDVLEHLHNPSDVINNCRYILNAGGKIISSIPNLMHYSVLYQLINGDFTYKDTGLLDKTHIHFFTYNEILRLFKNNKYKIINIKAINNVNTEVKDVTDFINELTELSTHKNKLFFEAYQYVTLAEKID